MPPATPLVANNFIFELDSVKCGLLRSYTGGGISAAVAEVPLDYYSKKHVAALSFEPCVMQVGFSFNGPFYEWIAVSGNGDTTRHDGSNP